VMNCNEDECIHIGDSYECDVVGANDAGIKSVWITSSNTITDDVSDYKSETVLSIDKILSDLTNSSLQ